MSGPYGARAMAGAARIVRRPQGSRLCNAGWVAAASTAAKCPSDDTLLSYADGLLDAVAVAQLETHLADCAQCSEFLRVFAEATVGGSTRRRTQGAPPVPERYTIKGPLGEGGQGSVWRAWDRDLEREVALKFVALVGARQREQFKKETRTLAQLDHPRVLEIYDIDLANTPCFFSAPVCSGGSLADLIGTQPRWQHVHELFAQAAQGLAAVHQAELVHRDVKPSNLLLTSHDSVKLGDFGLVSPFERAAQTHREDAPGPEESSPESSHASRLCGTLAYLAPEVRAGGSHSKTSDQYAFFVSLYQVLSGQLPGDFSPLRWVPAFGPKWLKSAIERGLTADPEQRFASMSAVVIALDHEGHTQHKTRTVMRSIAFTAVATVAALVLLVGVGSMSGGLGAAHPRADTPLAGPACTSQSPLAEAMTTAQLRAAIIAASSDKGDDRARAVELAGVLSTQITTYVAAWQTLNSSLCVAKRERGRLCLARNAERTRAVISRLTHGTLRPNAVGSAARILPELMYFEHCGRVDSEGDGPLQHPQTQGGHEARRAAAEAVHGAYAEEFLGDSELAARALADILEHGVARAFPDLLAEAHRREATRLLRNSAHEGVNKQLDQAAAMALKSNDPAVLARVWVEQTNYSALGLGDFNSARQHAAFARSALRRAGSPAPEAVRFAMVMTNIEGLHGHDEQAVAFAREAIEVARSIDSEALQGRARADLGELLCHMAQYERGLVELQEGVALLAGFYSGASNTFTNARHQLGFCLFRASRYEEAERYFRDLLHQTVRGGPDSIAHAIVLDSLGQVSLARDRFGQAEDSLNLAKTIYLSHDDNMRAAQTDMHLAELALRKGFPQQALGLLAGSRATLESQLGSEHPFVAAALELIAAAQKSVDEGPDAKIGASKPKKRD